MEYRENYRDEREPRSEGSFYNEPKYYEENQYYEGQQFVPEVEVPRNYPPLDEGLPVVVERPVMKQEKPAEEEKPVIPDGVIIHKLKKPVTLYDVEYTELRMDFNSLTGGDVEAALNEIGTTQSLVLEMDKRYHAALAARAAKVPYELFRYMGIADYTSITMSAQTFIMGL